MSNDTVDFSQSEEQPLNERTKRFDPSADREKLRGYLALGLMFLIIVIVICSFVSYIVTMKYSFDREWLKDWFGSIFTPVLTLFGTVTGFYFGEKSKE